MTTWKARPTTYRGIEMRSRLEAKYAAYLDRMGDEWTYEPRAFANERGQYLPDFRVEWGDCRIYIEVRPTLAGAERALEQMAIILDSEPAAVLQAEAAGIGYFIRWPDDPRWTWMAHE